MKLIFTALLFSCLGLAHAQECDLLVNNTFANGGYIKTSKEKQIYKLEGRSLKFYMENIDGQITLAVNWYISPKALPENASFNGKKPLLLIITLENGEKIELTIQEPKPGSGTYKLKYADYMLGGMTLLPEDIRQKLSKSNIRSITESLYGVFMPPVDDIKLPKYFINTIPCVSP